MGNSELLGTWHGETSSYVITESGGQLTFSWTWGVRLSCPLWGTGYWHEGNFLTGSVRLRLAVGGSASCIFIHFRGAASEAWGDRVSAFKRGPISIRSHVEFWLSGQWHSGVVVAHPDELGRWAIESDPDRKGARQPVVHTEIVQPSEAVSRRRSQGETRAFTICAGTVLLTHHRSVNFKSPHTWQEIGSIARGTRLVASGPPVKVSCGEKSYTMVPIKPVGAVDIVTCRLPVYVTVQGDRGRCLHTSIFCELGGTMLREVPILDTSLAVNEAVMDHLRKLDLMKPFELPFACHYAARLSVEMGPPVVSKILAMYRPAKSDHAYNKAYRDTIRIQKSMIASSSLRSPADLILLCTLAVTWQHNAVFRPPNYLVLLQWTSLCAHSCAPTAELRGPRDGGGGAWDIVAHRPLNINEEVTLSYLTKDMLRKSVEHRRAKLKSIWGFHCCCARCEEADARVKRARLSVT